MNSLQKNIFLLLVSLICVEVNAAKGNSHGYKVPDRRQQRQVTLKTAQHLKKLAEAPSMRYQSRHRIKPTALSNNQRALLIGLTFMLLTSSVIAAIPEKSSAVDSRPNHLSEPMRTDSNQLTYGPCEALPNNSTMLPTSSTTAAIPEKTSVVYSRPYYLSDPIRTDSIKVTYGLCETLSDNSTLCCGMNAEDITDEGPDENPFVRPDYTVTCCIHPSDAEYKRSQASCCRDNICHPNCSSTSLCISYDLDGIINDQTESCPRDFEDLLHEAKKECSSCMEPTRTHRIADEIKAFLKSKKLYIDFTAPEPEIIGNLTDSGADEALHGHLEGTTISGENCYIPIINIQIADNSLTISSIVKRLAQRWNLPSQDILIEIQDDRGCDWSSGAFGTAYAGRGSSSQEYRPLIGFELSLLLHTNDDQIVATTGHEMHHLKQLESSGNFWLPENNQEAEADIMSVLATNKPCIAVDFLENYYDDKLPLPMITQENAEQMLKGQRPDDPHPAVPNRISAVLIMNRHHKRAMEKLFTEFVTKKGMTDEEALKFLGDRYTYAKGSSV